MNSRQPTMDDGGSKWGNVTANVPYVVISVVVVALSLAVAYLQNGGFGFPLDDAWIHQVYARNLGTRLEFAFFPGQTSTGSTSPLWAILVAVGYGLRIDFRVWTILLGVVFLAASGWMTRRVMRHLTDDMRLVKWAAPLFMIMEWHLVWAAASGMEILLFVFLSLALIESFFAKRNVLIVGLLAGLLTLTRPEGILLAAIVGAGLVYRERHTLLTGRSLGLFAAYMLAFCVLLVPYFIFNIQTSGTLLPNTFYAKGAEYAELTASSNFLMRWLSMYRQPFIGAQLLLIPGLLYGGYVLARRQDLYHFLPALWILFLPALYAWRLPVEYQFGRYMMPIIPFIIVYGVVGTQMLFSKIPLRLLRRVWAMTIAVLIPVFLLIGANLYAQSAAIVNCEMVAMANWTRANLPPGALIAAHDIGAQGYFDEHRMLDLAGLVSPEVIPILHDEAKLKEWMIVRGAHYAIFFPTWYPRLAHDERFHEMFSTGCATTRGMGEENLRVYRLE